MIDVKDKKKLRDLFVKITNIFSDCYVFKNGYIISTDIEKPFIIQLEQKYIDYLKDLWGEFIINKIISVKDFKKAISEPTKKDNINEWPKVEDFYYVVSSQTETDKVISLLKTRINEINSCMSWENFTLSDNKESNTKLILSLFTDNNYVNFRPKDTDNGPEIILTKSLLPLVSEKNYTDLFYSSRKINSNLFLIIFDFQFSLFRLYMFHNYIPIKEDD